MRLRGFGAARIDRLLLVVASCLVVAASACGDVDPTPPGASPPSGTDSSDLSTGRRGPGRGVAEEKVDANLLRDVRSPEAQGERLVDISTATPTAVSAAVGELGGRVVGPPGADALRAWMPVSSVERIALRQDVRTVKPAAGAATS